MSKLLNISYTNIWTIRFQLLRNERDMLIVFVMQATREDHFMS